MTELRTGRTWRFHYKVFLVFTLAVLARLSYSVINLNESLSEWWTDLDSRADDATAPHNNMEVMNNSTATIIQQQQQQPKATFSSITNATTATSTTTTKNNQAEDDISICFVTSVYAKWASLADELQELNETLLPGLFVSNNNNNNNNSSHSNNSNSTYHFYVYTNLPRLRTRGWTPILKQDDQYSRFITQSRWPKFLAWKEAHIQQECQVVFYMDSSGHILGTPQDFQREARNILQSNIGFAQYLHKGGGGALGELRRVEVFHKDVMSNINASKKWLLQQPDFDNNCTLYENRYFGYTPQSPSFQQASQFLWDHYSLEQDSWRDQPLWCYVLDHLHMTPIPLDHKRLFKVSIERMRKKKHNYGATAEGDASKARIQKEEKNVN